MEHFRWVVLALLGAFFAAVVSVLTKRALDKADFLVALCVQSAVMLLTLATITTAFGRWKAFPDAPRWALGLAVQVVSFQRSY